MKRLFVYSIFFLLCHISVKAQEMSRAEVVKQYNVAISYITGGNNRYAEAREIFERILPYADAELRERIISKIPMTWYDEGAQYLIQMNYIQAFSCMEKARDGFHMNCATKDEINALVNIGLIKNFQYDMNGSMIAYQQACVLADSIRYDSKLITILNELRIMSERLGDNEQTLSIDKKIDSIASVTEDKEVLFYYYCQQGNKARSFEEFDLVEQWYRKNESFINQLDDDDNGYAKKIAYYSNMLNLYSYSRKWNEALKYAILYKDVSQRVHNEKDGDYYISYGRIADVYKMMGDSIRCFQCIDTLFLSLERQDEPRSMYELYLRRALCYSRFKNYVQALVDYKTADSLLASKYSENDGDRISLLPLMGGMELRLGHFDESERLYRKYAEGIKSIYGTTHSKYIDALVFLANAEGFSDHIEAACNDYAAAADILKQQIQNMLPYLSTAERDSYWREVSEMILRMTPFALEAKEYQTAFTRTCYDGLVLSKAFLLESDRSTYDLIKKSGTAEDIHDFTIIAAMQSIIREWGKKGYEYTDSILALSGKIKQLESQLAGKCRSYGDLTSFMKIGYQEIKDRLNDGDVLIDFSDYVSESKGRTYAAYVIDNVQKYPLLVKLFTESKIDSMQVSNPDMFYKSPYAESICQLLWKPFKKYVKEGATVYYVPSQLLFQIALESLPTEDGTLLGDHFHFVRLSSARELVNLKNDISFDLDSDRTCAVLYGGLQYDLEKSDLKKEAGKYNISPLLAFRGGSLRGDSIFRDLPCSLKEVKEINKILTSSNISVKPYMGINGTEESFIDLSGKAPPILHLATHGFYYTPTEAQKYDYLRGCSDAMSLSGIVMSGGNTAWLGKDLPEGVLSGILTAADISRLDLNGVKLVVLSACHSGRGKATSEGLYGLQRAFKKAGANTMILSLWEVSDVVGTEFMITFYRFLCEKDNHWNKRAAFEKAKSDIRRKYKDPFYWASFVMLD